jgi:hypothetical protein
MAVLAVGLFAGHASACVCAQVSFREDFRQASSIFAGKFVRSEWRAGVRNEMHEIALESEGKKGEPYQVEVQIFEVETWWKGPGTREVALVTDHTRAPDKTESMSDCGLGFTIGQTYLIYAYDNDKNLSTSACSRTAKLASARGDVKKLNAIRKGRKPFA